MAERFFVETPVEARRATLTGAEAHHLAHVMRAGPGTEVTLFDGSGAEFTARVEQVGRSSVELLLLSRHEVDRELPFALTLGVALPKGDRQRWLVEKATELGVTRLVPLTTRRGVAQPVGQAIGRLRRYVVEASKQCGRNRLLEISQPQEVTDYLASAPGGAIRWLAQPGGEPLPPADGVHALAAGVFLAIGPEGGFTEEEVSAALESGWHAVSLGPRILRIETAAVLLAACWSRYPAHESSAD
jgi:16S rRNA (uracil1498-N3)-methyltransferase